LFGFSYGQNARRAFNLPVLAYNGTLTSKPQLIFEDIQKQEDDIAKAKENHTNKKPLKIILQPQQQVIFF
jgi:hypothetical protein